MAFLEELGRTLTDTGKEVATKAKAITESIQLKSQITGEKAKLADVYAAIGRIYYEANKEPEEEYEKAFEAVKVIRERLAGLEADLTQSEGNRICAVCGTKVPKDFSYCGKCGAAIKEEAAQGKAGESAFDEGELKGQEPGNGSKVSECRSKESGSDFEVLGNDSKESERDSKAPECDSRESECDSRGVERDSRGGEHDSKAPECGFGIPEAREDAFVSSDDDEK